MIKKKCPEPHEKQQNIVKHNCSMLVDFIKLKNPQPLGQPN